MFTIKLIINLDFKVYAWRSWTRGEVYPEERSEDVAVWLRLQPTPKGGCKRSHKSGTPGAAQVDIRSRC